jgi:hypothetical protein
MVWWEACFFLSILGWYLACNSPDLVLLSPKRCRSPYRITVVDWFENKQYTMAKAGDSKAVDSETLVSFKLLTLQTTL